MSDSFTITPGGSSSSHQPPAPQPATVAQEQQLNMKDAERLMELVTEDERLIRKCAGVVLELARKLGAIPEADLEEVRQIFNNGSSEEIVVCIGLGNTGKSTAMNWLLRGAGTPQQGGYESFFPESPRKCTGQRCEVTYGEKPGIKIRADDDTWIWKELPNGVLSKKDVIRKNKPEVCVSVNVCPDNGFHFQTEKVEVPDMTPVEARTPYPLLQMGCKFVDAGGWDQGDEHKEDLKEYSKQVGCKNVHLVVVAKCNDGVTDSLKSMIDVIATETEWAEILQQNLTFVQTFSHEVEDCDDEEDAAQSDEQLTQEYFNYLRNVCDGFGFPLSVRDARKTAVLLQLNRTAEDAAQAQLLRANACRLHVITRVAQGRQQSHLDQFNEMGQMLARIQKFLTLTPIQRAERRRDKDIADAKAALGNYIAAETTRKREIKLDLQARLRASMDDNKENNYRAIKDRVLIQAYLGTGVSDRQLIDLFNDMNDLYLVMQTQNWRTVQAEFTKDQLRELARLEYEGQDIGECILREAVTWAVLGGCAGAPETLGLSVAVGGAFGAVWGLGIGALDAAKRFLKDNAQKARNLARGNVIGDQHTRAAFDTMFSHYEAQIPDVATTLADAVWKSGKTNHENKIRRLRQEFNAIQNPIDFTGEECAEMRKAGNECITALEKIRGNMHEAWELKQNLEEKATSRPYGGRRIRPATTASHQERSGSDSISVHSHFFVQSDARTAVSAH